NVPFGDEFRVRDVNHSLLQSLAGQQPRGGTTGILATPLGDADLSESLNANPYREGLTKVGTIQDVWPWFVLGGCCLFLGDIFIRRVAVGVGWVYTAWDAVRGARKEAAPTARLDSLLKNKEQLTTQWQRERAAVRFEIEPELPPASSGGNGKADAERAGRAAVKASLTTENPTIGDAGGGPATHELSYTERLLEAKRKARK
ncbi:MAG: hypothetical protein ACO1RT_10325, partial [Planctomycetaceae bacterium]